MKTSRVFQMGDRVIVRHNAAFYLATVINLLPKKVAILRDNQVEDCRYLDVTLVEHRLDSRKLLGRVVPEHRRKRSEFMSREEAFALLEDSAKLDLRSREPTDDDVYLVDKDHPSKQPVTGWFCMDRCGNEHGPFPSREKAVRKWRKFSKIKPSKGASRRKKPRKDDWND